MSARYAPLCKKWVINLPNEIVIYFQCILANSSVGTRSGLNPFNYCLGVYVNIQDNLRKLGKKLYLIP